LLQPLRLLAPLDMLARRITPTHRCGLSAVFRPAAPPTFPHAWSAPRWGRSSGQQIVVENRLGAASSIAGAQAARAPNDGYTLFVSSAANMINAAMNPNLNFDIMKDFAPIALMTSTPTVLTVIPELGVKSVKELTALAKEKPDTLSFGSSGTGSSTHLALELFTSLAASRSPNPYSGSPQVVTDL
jgi:tripartite-type tricarboxylate transporter receptor subunit TctC